MDEFEDVFAEVVKETLSDGEVAMGMEEYGGEVVDWAREGEDLLANVIQVPSTGSMKDVESWIDSERSEGKTKEAVEKVRVSLKDKREKEAKEFPPEMIGEDWSGTTSSLGKKMTEEERKVMLFKRKLRNRESAARSRRKRQKTLEELQEELRQMSEDASGLMLLAKELLERERDFVDLKSSHDALEDKLVAEKSKVLDLEQALEQLQISKVSTEKEALQLREENRSLKKELETLPDEIRRVTGERDILLRKIAKDRRLVGLFGVGEPSSAAGFGNAISQRIVSVGGPLDDAVIGG